MTHNAKKSRIYRSLNIRVSSVIRQTSKHSSMINKIKPVLLSSLPESTRLKKRKVTLANKTGQFLFCICSLVCRQCYCHCRNLQLFQLNTVGKWILRRQFRASIPGLGSADNFNYRTPEHKPHFEIPNEPGNLRPGEFFSQ